MAAGERVHLLRYTQTELDPVVQAEVLLGAARVEARMAALVILLTLGFGVVMGFADPRFAAVAAFAAIIVVPLAVDLALRRIAARRLQGWGPAPHGPSR